MDISFSPTSIYEVVFINASEASDALDLYLGPLASEARSNGAVSVALLDVTHIEHSDFDCRHVCIVRWPSLQAYETFHARDAWPRDVLLNRVSFPVVVADDTRLSLHRDGRYEFAAFWMNRENAALSASYFDAMGPVIRVAAPRPMLPMRPILPSGPIGVAPDRFNLLEWTGPTEARAAMFTSKEFQSSGHMRALAMDRLVTVMVAPPP